MRTSEANCASGWGDLSLQIETMLEVKPDASLKVCIHHTILPHHALIKPQIPKLGSYDDARFFPHIRTEVTYAIISIYDWTSGGEKDQYRTGCEGSGVKITSISFSNKTKQSVSSSLKTPSEVTTTPTKEINNKLKEIKNIKYIECT